MPSTSKYYLANIGLLIIFVFLFSISITSKRGIKIYGCLIALGSIDEKIHLGDPEATFTPGSGHWWNGIEFHNTSQNGESVLKYCTLRAVRHIDESKETAIYCENSSPIIDHCTIMYMGTGTETGGCSALGLVGQSYPIVSYCTFKNIMRGVAFWCNPFNYQDTVNYPSPLVFGCNLKGSIQGFHWPQCDFDIVVLNGGFLDNCFLGVGSIFADTTLGYPVDTIGDGICNTTSTYELQQKFLKVDGVVNPRGDTLITGIDEKEINILPTTTKYLKLNKNYPNPFSKSTTIDFEVNKWGTIISLFVYDSKGSLVKKLIERLGYPKGSHSINWYADNDNGSKVKPGIYFYKLESDGVILVKKAILVK
jgi:hypothetical protein